MQIPSGAGRGGEIQSQIKHHQKKSVLLTGGNVLREDHSCGDHDIRQCGETDHWGDALSMQILPDEIMWSEDMEKHITVGDKSWENILHES